MEETLKIILDALVPIVITLLSGFLTWLGTKVKKYYDEKATEETIRSVINSTVKYVEQVYKDLHGPEKFEEAKKIAQDWLASKGINISEAELAILIESFVNGLTKDVTTTETKSNTIC